MLIKIAYKKSTIDAGAHVENCGDNQMASEGKFCHFDVNAIPSQCSVENHFGYQRGDPCVLIKLNKVKIFNIHDCFAIHIIVLGKESSWMNVDFNGKQ